MQLAASGTFGAATVGVAYQDDNNLNGMEVFGVSVGASLAGADLTLAYADNGTDQSTGVAVSYPVGPVTLGAHYVMEGNAATDDAWGVSAAYASGAVSVSAAYDSTDDWSLEGSYDVGNGLTIFAGVVAAGDDYYVAGSYDLGGGANLLVSYVEDGGAANGDDEIGANDYQAGATVEVSFAF